MPSWSEVRSCGPAPTPCLGHDTRGTSAWMNALYWKKFRCRHTHPACHTPGTTPRRIPSPGSEREPGAKPIVMCNSRLPSAPSRNSTPDTLHGSGNCKAAVNSEVVSISPNFPNVLTVNQSSPTPNSERPHNFVTSYISKAQDVYARVEQHDDAK